MNTKYTLLINKVTGDRSVRNNKTGEVVIEKDNPVLYNELRKKAVNNQRNKQRNQLYSDLGLKKTPYGWE